VGGFECGGFKGGEYARVSSAVWSDRAANSCSAFRDFLGVGRSATVARAVAGGGEVDGAAVTLTVTGDRSCCASFAVRDGDVVLPLRGYGGE
jgi:hypothetical protein